MENLLSLSILLNIGFAVMLLIGRMRRNQLNRDMTALAVKVVDLDEENGHLSDLYHRYKGAWESTRPMGMPKMIPIDPDIIETLRKSGGI